MRRIGPSEFNITGTLKTWDITSQLTNITAPTLVINGEYDEAQDVCVEPFAKQIKGAKWVKFKNSSHMPFFEERKEYMTTVCKFLDEQA